MERSPSWDATSHSGSQETLCLLWNPKIHYFDHKGPLLAPILSQMDPVPTIPPYFPNIHRDVFPSTPQFSKWSFIFRFSNQNILSKFHVYEGLFPWG
jgi:hypothetical protein